MRWRAGRLGGDRRTVSDAILGTVSRQCAGTCPSISTRAIHDGHTGSVPIHHAIDAFNVIARANGDKLVSDADIATPVSRE